MNKTNYIVVAAALLLFMGVAACRNAEPPAEIIEIATSGNEWLKKTVTSYTASRSYIRQRSEAIQLEYNRFRADLLGDGFLNPDKVNSRKVDSLLDSMRRVEVQFARTVDIVESAAADINISAIDIAYETVNSRDEIEKLRQKVNKSWRRRERADAIAARGPRIRILTTFRSKRMEARASEAGIRFLGLNDQYNALWRKSMIAEYLALGGAGDLGRVYQAFDEAHQASRDATWTTIQTQTELQTLVSRYETARGWLMLEPAGTVSDAAIGQSVETAKPVD